MAYADTIRTNTCDMEDVADLIDGLIITSDTVTKNGLSSTASTSYVDLTTTGVSLSPDGTQDVYIFGYVAVSCGTAADRVEILAYEDTTAGGAITSLFTANSTSTAGAKVTIPIFHIFSAPSAGSHTYKLKWKVAGGAAGTIYSANYRMQAFLVQQ